MHHGLRIPELLDNIFSNFLDSKYYLNPNTATLACLARTCRIFMDPALDALWMKQTTLNNILKCLPSECWEESIIVGNHPRRKTIRLLRPPKAADWHVASKYHTRVRSLELHFEDDNFPSSELFEALSLAFSAEGIFPNLRGLNWQYLLDKTPYPPVFQHIRLFTSPRLTNFHLNYRTNEQLSLVLALPLPLQTLEDLSIVTYEVYTSHPDLTAFTLKLSAIRDLCLPSLSNETFSHLSALPKLSDLEISDTREEVGILLRPLSFDSFAALSRLCLSRSTVNFALQLLEAVPMWRLECFHDEEDMLDPPHELDEYALSGDSLTCLFHLLNLTSVTLESPAGFIIDDAQIWHLARSWTALEYLVLGTGSRLQVRPTTTIDAFCAFGMHCTKLHILKISVDATNVPAFEADREPRIIQTNLRLLDVRESPINDSERVGSFLSGMFGALSGINTSQAWRWEERSGYAMQRVEEEQEKKHYERWKEVENYIFQQEQYRPQAQE
ncbi:hypothetical protein C8F01DRAFT_1259365 [Mycena amicta]|nr:hypothetical protein C8F01DRAFT_1259365 [Mycena amicta]